MGSGRNGRGAAREGGQRRRISGCGCSSLLSFATQPLFSLCPAGSLSSLCLRLPFFIFVIYHRRARPAAAAAAEARCDLPCKREAGPATSQGKQGGVSKQNPLRARRLSERTRAAEASGARRGTVSCSRAAVRKPQPQPSQQREKKKTTQRAGEGIQAAAARAASGGCSTCGLRPQPPSPCQISCKGNAAAIRAKKRGEEERRSRGREREREA